MSTHITVVPAYGRDYRSKEEVLQAWEAGNDFQIRDVSSRWDGSYINKEDAGKSGLATVDVRFNSLRNHFLVKVATNKAAGGWEPGQVDEEGWEDGHVVLEDEEEEPSTGQGSQVPPARDSHTHELNEVGRPMEPGQALREASIEDAWNAFAAKVAASKQSKIEHKITVNSNDMSVSDMQGATPWGERIGQVAYFDKGKGGNKVLRAVYRVMREFKSKLEAMETGDSAIGFINQEVYRETGKSPSWRYIQLPM